MIGRGRWLAMHLGGETEFEIEGVPAPVLYDWLTVIPVNALKEHVEFNLVAQRAILRKLNHVVRRDLLRELQKLDPSAAPQGTGASAWTAWC